MVYFVRVSARGRVSVCVGVGGVGVFKVILIFITAFLCCCMFHPKRSSLPSVLPSRHSLSLPVFHPPSLRISPCHLPVTTPPSLKQARLVFLHPSRRFRNFSPLTFIAVFLLRRCLHFLRFTLSLFMPSLYSPFQKTAAYLLR